MKTISPLLRVNESRFASFRAMADGSLLRTATLHNKPYIVVPIVSAVGDEVWWPANSEVPELVPAEVLQASYWSRNNRPIVAGHPRVDGEYVSANSPDILERYSYGHLFAAQYENKKVKVEAWFDKNRANEVGPAATNIIARLEAGEQIEVSEGNFVVAVDEQGHVNGKEYKSKWVSAICDHLATVDEGACSNKMGCGGPRVNQLRVASLAQARTPKYSGTETTSWTRPTFQDFIRYCYNGDEPPTSVSKCSSELKREIANHSLLGDPDATSFGELTSLTVVNPSNGKLNENALRLALKSDNNSAVEIARRLLNSEFSANLEAKDMKASDKKSNMLKRMLASMSSALKGAMSNNELRMKLYKVLSESEPGMSYVYDEDVNSGQVIYCTTIRYGEYWDTEVEYNFWRRTFNMTPEGVVSVNDDAVEVEWFEGWKDKPATQNESETESETIVASTAAIVTAATCQCQHKEEESKMNASEKKILITKLIGAARSPFEESDRQTLESMDEKKLTSLIKAYEGEVTATGETTAPVVESTVTTPVNTVEVPAGQVLISTDELADIKASAAAFRKQQEIYRTGLITTLKSAQSAFNEDDLKAMSTTSLEKLSISLKVDQPAMVDYSVRGVAESRVSSSGPVMRELPDTWGLNKAN